MFWVFLPDVQALWHGQAGTEAELTAGRGPNHGLVIFLSICPAFMLAAAPNCQQDILPDEIWPVLAQGFAEEPCRWLMSPDPGEDLQMGGILVIAGSNW